MPTLRLVPQRAPSTEESLRARRRPAQGEAIQCRCGSRELFTVLVGAQLVDGKVTGGTKQHLCAACYVKGERVVLA